VYSILDIAEYFLGIEKMTHKKLQKLCYYAYAWYFAIKGERLCYDACFQAWVHGPVSRKLWDRFKGSGLAELSPSRRVTLDKAAAEIIECVWEKYGAYDGNRLEALTHREAPWRNARYGLEPDQHCSMVIEDSDMMSYYLPICARALKKRKNKKAS